MRAEQPNLERAEGQALRCQRCAVEVSAELTLCPLCKGLLLDGDGTLEGAPVARTVVGRIRGPTDAEIDAAASVFRADAVLALTADTPADLPALAMATARLIDSVRPVARIRKKSGASSAALRDALRLLQERGLIRLVGIVECATTSSRMQSDDDATRRVTDAELLLSPRAMAEIKEMLDEDQTPTSAPPDGRERNDDTEETEFPGSAGTRR